MSKPAAIQADYVDLKFVKGRKVAQIVVEIPIEQASAFVDAFGTPLPDRTVPVALARIQPLKEQLLQSVEHEKQKREWKDLSRAQQAGIACNEKGFWQFLKEQYGEPVASIEDAAVIVRKVCGEIVSRRELDTTRNGRHAWDSLYSNYTMWLKYPEQAA